MKNKVEWQVVSGGIVLGLLFCVVGLGCGLSACSAEPDPQEDLFPVSVTPHDLTPAMVKELRGCFDFFWNEWVVDPALPTYGLNAGDYVGLKKTMPLAIESQGFYFPILVLGVERGWVDRKQAEDRVLVALDSLLKLKHFHGFFYHFIDVETGARGWHSDRVEVSNMSTATMIAGALMAGEYFGGEVREKANALYSRIDWNWFLDERQHHFHMACHPEHVPKGRRVDERGMFGHWDAYSEHLIMYILAAGAPEATYAIDERPYAAMLTPIGSYKGEPFVFCRTGSAFVYQWTHCFIDFRHMVDAEERNWFENSRQAALAAHRFAIDSASTVKGLGPNSWGMSASMSPTRGYSGHYGSMPADKNFLDMDGTIAPYGPLGFVVFTPKLSLAALEHMHTIPGLTGKYGLYDAYSFETKAKGDQPWIGKSYLAIDKGIVALMFENYATQLIWRYLHRSSHVQRGLKRCGFQAVEPMK